MSNATSERSCTTRSGDGGATNLDAANMRIKDDGDGSSVRSGITWDKGADIIPGTRTLGEFWMIGRGTTIASIIEHLIEIIT